MAGDVILDYELPASQPSEPLLAVSRSQLESMLRAARSEANRGGPTPGSTRKAIDKLPPVGGVGASSTTQGDPHGKLDSSDRTAAGAEGVFLGVPAEVPAAELPHAGSEVRPEGRALVHVLDGDTLDGAASDSGWISVDHGLPQPGTEVLLWAEAHPHAAAGPYPTAMRQATAEEARALTLYTEAQVLNAARCAGLSEEQWLRLKAYLPVPAGVMESKEGSPP
jgi:hypothetical protein